MVIDFSKSRSIRLLLICFVICNGCSRSDEEEKTAHTDERDVAIRPTTAPTTNDIMKRVAEQAKEFVAKSRYKDEVDPEPVELVELADRWNVWFKYRPKLVERNGKFVEMQQYPEMLNVVVRKPDLTVEIVPVR